MAVFDPFIADITDYIELLREKDRQVRELFAPSDLDSIISRLSIKAGSKSASNIVLKSDTFLELGSPAAGSCAITLYSNNPAVLQDGRCILIGPDVKESPSSMLPFGQVLMVGGKQLTIDDYRHLLQWQNESDLEGYMIKSTSENIWSRISNEASQKGFNLQVLGTNLIQRIKMELPKAESVEVLFVTSNKEDITELQKIGVQVKEIIRETKGKYWKYRGVDLSDCIPGVHCGLCEDKSVCDEIRKMAAARCKNV